MLRDLLQEMRGFAVVTGASSGIGFALADKLSRKGFGIIACGRDSERLAAVWRMCRDRGVGFRAVCADLSDPERCLYVADLLSDKSIVMLVNSAGAGEIGDFDLISDRGDIDSVTLNVIAPQLLTKSFCRTRNKGIVVNVCSSAAFAPDPLMATYGAVKSYLYSYTLAADRELRERGSDIRIIALCPGGVKTRFDERAGVTKPLAGKMSADRCAELCISGLLSGERVILPGIVPRMSRIACRLLPEKVTASVQYRLQKSKVK